MLPDGDGGFRQLPGTQLEIGGASILLTPAVTAFGPSDGIGCRFFEDGPDTWVDGSNDSAGLPKRRNVVAANHSVRSRLAD